MNDYEPLRLRTHTSLWRVEKRLYKLYDWTLPMPIGLRQLGIFLGVAIPWFVLVNLVGVPFGPPFGHLIWLTPPVLAAWAANRPVAEGKRLGELIFSQVKYVTQPRRYAQMAAHTEAQTFDVRGEIWLPNGHTVDLAGNTQTSHLRTRTSQS